MTVRERDKFVPSPAVDSDGATVWVLRLALLGTLHEAEDAGCAVGVHDRLPNPAQVLELRCPMAVPRLLQSARHGGPDIVTRIATNYQNISCHSAVS